MSTALHPYLNFDGDCAEAMTFYADALGLPVEIMRFKDSPMPPDPATADRVMHATIKGGGLVLMASDTMPGMPAPGGTNVHLSLSFDDPAEQDRVFAALGHGGTVTMPLAQQFFGRFGMLTDRYGVSWMFMHETPHGG